MWGIGDIPGGVELALRLALAAVFALAAAAKLADRAATRDALIGFGAGPRLAAPGTWALPLTELAVAALLVVPATARWGGSAALAVLAVFTAALVRAGQPDCNCFGALGGGIAGRPLARNAVLAGAAAVVALPAPATALAAGLALALAAAIVVTRRRVRTGRTRPAGAPAGHAPAPADALPTVPPVGAPAPRFALPAIAGGWVTLDDLLLDERPVLLVFSDPACAACEALPARLADLRDGTAGELTIALVTRGSPDDGPFAPVLVQSEHEVARAYGAGHVPSAVLVDPDGRVASALAVGEHAIERLAAPAIRELVH